MTSSGDFPLPTIRFGPREFGPAAEPVTGDDLRNGVVYFALQFADPNLLVPIVEPLIFVGRNLRQNDTGSLYFHSFESYEGQVPAPTGRLGPDFQVYHLGETNHIFEYERALDELMRCAIRRKNALDKL